MWIRWGWMGLGQAASHPVTASCTKSAAKVTLWELGNMALPNPRAMLPAWMWFTVASGCHLA